MKKVFLIGGIVGLIVFLITTIIFVFKVNLLIKDGWKFDKNDRDPSGKIFTVVRYKQESNLLILKDSNGNIFRNNFENKNKVIWKTRLLWIKFYKQVNDKKALCPDKKVVIVSDNNKLDNDSIRQIIHYNYLVSCD